MYVVAGVTGRVGSATARHLLDAGAEVRVLVRRESDAAAWEAQGAEVRVVALDDRAALGEALDDVSGFFVLLPFDLTATDLDAHADALATSIAGAVADRAVPHVVMLSSAGADLGEGTGPITGLHRLEIALRATGATVTALRSGHFQEKFVDVLDAARHDGIYPVFASSIDNPLPMVATADIGAFAAGELLDPSHLSTVVDIIGPAYTEREVAEMLGAALGRDVRAVTIPREGWIESFVDAGFNTHVAASLAALYQADEQGLLSPRGDRSIHSTTRLDETIERVLRA